MSSLLAQPPTAVSNITATHPFDLLHACSNPPSTSIDQHQRGHHLHTLNKRAALDLIVSLSFHQQHESLYHAGRCELGERDPVTFQKARVGYHLPWIPPLLF